MDMQQLSERSMTPIIYLIKLYGSQSALADAMGTTQGQVSRWKSAGAFVDDNGAVYLKTAQTKLKSACN